MDPKDFKARLEQVKALAKEQLGRTERMGAPTGPLAAALLDGERLDRLFSGQVDGKSALVGLTDRRLIVVYGGLLTKTQAVPYDQIHQVETGTLSVTISGSGVGAELKWMPRAHDLAQELQVRREALGRAPAATDGGGASDPLAQLGKLAELHEAGVVTDAEFAAKKAELLRRI